MAVTQCIPTSFKSEILSGVHESADTYKIALYLQGSASLGPATTAYTASGEVTGSGYSAGGASLSGFSVTTSGTTAILDWTSDPTWPNRTITADAFMIYNSSQSNKAVYIGTFGSTSTTNGTFTVILPTPDASNGLIRIA
jgi:hypothetical protein